jgi:hypothetical protein
MGILSLCSYWNGGRIEDMRKGIKILKRSWQWISHGYTLWGILNMIFPSIGGILGGVFTWVASLPSYVIFFGVVCGIAFGLLISNEFAARRILKRISLNIGRNTVSEESVKAEASSHFNNKRISITELAGDSILVKNKVFIDCELMGAAVINFKNSVITECRLEGKLEDILIVIDYPRVITGIIRFENCVFRKCRFSKIGIVTNKAEEEMWRMSVSS